MNFAILFFSMWCGCAIKSIAASTPYAGNQPSLDQGRPRELDVLASVEVPAATPGTSAASETVATEASASAAPAALEATIPPLPPTTEPASSASSALTPTTVPDTTTIDPWNLSAMSADAASTLSSEDASEIDEPSGAHRNTKDSNLYGMDRPRLTLVIIVGAVVALLVVFSLVAWRSRHLRQRISCGDSNKHDSRLQSWSLQHRAEQASIANPVTGQSAIRFSRRTAKGRPIGLLWPANTLSFYRQTFRFSDFSRLTVLEDRDYSDFSARELRDSVVSDHSADGMGRESIRIGHESFMESLSDRDLEAVQEILSTHKRTLCSVDFERDEEDELADSKLSDFVVYL